MRIEDLHDDPYPVLARLRAREPVGWNDSLRGWVVTDRRLAEEVLTSDRFTVEADEAMNLRILGEHMLSRDGAEHRRHRGPFDPAFRFRPVRERYGELVRGIADGLVDAFADDGAADLRPAFARPLPIAVMTAVLGLDADPGELNAWYDDFALALGNYERDPEIDRRAWAARAELEACVVATLGRCPSASSLIAEAHEALSAEEIARNVAILLFGGIETAESLVLNATWALLGDESALTVVRADRALVANVVDEALRWEPPVQILDRWATEDTTLGGAEIRRGDWVNVMVGAVNRDPELFPDPDRFDVHRANAGRHLSFGHGPHLCIGFNLARLEGQIAVATLLDRLPGLRLDPDHPTAPRGAAFRKPPHLHVRWAVPAL